MGTLGPIPVKACTLNSYAIGENFPGTATLHYSLEGTRTRCAFRESKNYNSIRKMVRLESPGWDACRYAVSDRIWALLYILFFWSTKGFLSVLCVAS